MAIKYGISALHPAILALAMVSLTNTVGATQSPDEARASCNTVFYCQTTVLASITPEGGIDRLAPESFRFALKPGEVIISEERSLLGDGTAGYKVIAGGACDLEGKLVSLSGGKPWFNATMLNGERFLKFRAGEMQGTDIARNGFTLAWYATCDSFK